MANAAGGSMLTTALNAGGVALLAVLVVLDQFPPYFALVMQHARHDHLERDHFELFDAEPRDDGAAWHEDLLAPDVRAVGDQLVHGRAWQGLGLELRRGLT